MPSSRASSQFGRRLASAALLILAVACGDILGGPCPDEERSVTATGDIVDMRGRRLGAAHMVVGERRDSSRASQGAFVAVDLLGPDTTGGPLRGHVATLRLLGPGDMLVATAPLEQIPSGSSGSSFLVRTLLMQFDDTTSVAPLRQLLLQDRLRVELTTDEQPARTFLVPLRRKSVTAWAHLMCL